MLSHKHVRPDLPCILCKLPRELRDHIYHYILLRDNHSSSSSSESSNQRRPHQLRHIPNHEIYLISYSDISSPLLLCRQFHYELTNLACATEHQQMLSITFGFGKQYHPRHFFSQLTAIQAGLSPALVSHLRVLELQHVKSCFSDLMSKGDGDEPKDNQKGDDDSLISPSSILPELITVAQLIFPKLKTIRLHVWLDGWQEYSQYFSSTPTALHRAELSAFLKLGETHSTRGGVTVCPILSVVDYRTSGADRHNQHHRRHRRQHHDESIGVVVKQAAPVEVQRRRVEEALQWDVVAEKKVWGGPWGVRSGVGWGIPLMMLCVPLLPEAGE
ncbi:hypothetical protein SMMN14_09014 [Sphaerulina musiva]